MADAPTQANTPVPRWMLSGDDVDSPALIRGWADAQMTNFIKRMRGGFKPTPRDLVKVEQAYTAANDIEAWHKLPES